MHIRHGEAAGIPHLPSCSSSRSLYPIVLSQKIRIKKQNSLIMFVNNHTKYVHFATIAVFVLAKGNTQHLIIALVQPNGKHGYLTVPRNWSKSFAGFFSMLTLSLMAFFFFFSLFFFTPNWTNRVFSKRSS